MIDSATAPMATQIAKITADKNLLTTRVYRTKGGIASGNYKVIQKQNLDRLVPDNEMSTFQDHWL